VKVNGAVSGGALFVAMVQAANFGDGNDATLRTVLDASWRWHVFGQRREKRRRLSLQKASGPTVDRLFVVHRDVDKARDRLKKGDLPARR